MSDPTITVQIIERRQSARDREDLVGCVVGVVDFTTSQAVGEHVAEVPVVQFVESAVARACHRPYPLWRGRIPSPIPYVSASGVFLTVHVAALACGIRSSPPSPPRRRAALFSSDAGVQYPGIRP